jgi:small-conductance mechanosensitive channel
MEILNNFLDFDLLHFGEHTLKVYTIISILTTILITKVLIWVIKKALYSKSKFRSFDEGNSFALFQIIKYLIWIIAIGLVLETVGLQMNVLLASSAALMVGVGLGLQQTFNDIISGVILLFEGTTKVGDVLEIDNEVIVVQSIGLRTSKGLSRDEIVIIIPNSLITTNKVINWSHQTKKTRFKINIGVSYGSDINKVEIALKESVLKHPNIKPQDFIEARFIDFGNSSLDFQILFFSREVFRIERIKSEIRKIVILKFQEVGITIPFPQMDLHVIPVPGSKV